MLLQLQDQDYKYLENAEDATLKGSAPTRLFTIEEVRSGWWKQGTVTVQTTTMLPAHTHTGTTSTSGSRTCNSQGATGLDGENAEILPFRAECQSRGGLRSDLRFWRTDSRVQCALVIVDSRLSVLRSGCRSVGSRRRRPVRRRRLGNIGRPGPSHFAEPGRATRAVTRPRRMHKHQSYDQL